MSRIWSYDIDLCLEAIKDPTGHKHVERHDSGQSVNGQWAQTVVPSVGSQQYAGLYWVGGQEKYGGGHPGSQRKVKVITW